MKLMSIAFIGGAATLLIGMSQIPVELAAPAQDVTVRGAGICGTAGPVGRYTLEWTVENPGNIGEVTVLSATESGAYEGTVDISPSVLSAGEAGTGTDGPVEGNTIGVVTLTVEYATSGGGQGEASGEAHLAGDCNVLYQ